VKKGEPIELRWVTTGAEKVWLDPPGEELPGQGRLRRLPQGSTVYWLFAGNGKGGHSVPASVEVVESAPVPLAGFWIQFAALADAKGAERLQNELERRLTEPVKLFQVAAPKRAELRLSRVRTGPYPTRVAAQRHLREILLKVRALRLKPVVMAE